MPVLEGKIWQEECFFMDDFKQLGNNKQEETVEIVQCKYVANGSTCDEALRALDFHIKGKHAKEIEYREREARQEADAAEERKEARKKEEKIEMMQREIDMEAEKVRRVKIAEATGEEMIGKKLNEIT